MNLQPDLSLSVPIKRNNGGGPDYFTIQEILTFCHEQGFNSFFLNDSGYTWSGLIISMWNFPEHTTDLYLADNTYLGIEGAVGVNLHQSSGFHKNALSSGYGSLQTKDTLSGDNPAQTINNVMYYYQSSTREYANQGTIYYGGTYDNIYINGEKIPDYTIDLIHYIDASGTECKFIYEGDSEPITYQAIKYVRLQNNNGPNTLDFCNSAICCSNRTGYNDYNLGMTIFSLLPFKIKYAYKFAGESTWNYDSKGTWNYQSGSNCYSKQYYHENKVGNEVFYSTGIYQTVGYSQITLIDSYLPFFTDIAIYNDFVTLPYYPPKLGGGAGSGYIGDHGLVNKKMVGFNVMTSDDPDTKTESVEEAYELPIAGKPKIGNGFCRIKFLRSIEPPNGFKIYNLDDEIGCKCYFNSMHVKTVRDVVQIVENANLGNIIAFLDMGWTWTGLNIEPKDFSGDSVYLYDKNYDPDTGSSVCYIGIKDVYSSPASMYMLNGDGTAIAFSEARTHNWSSKSGEPFPQGYCYASYESTSVTCNYEGGIYIPKSINVYLNDQLYRSAM